MAKKIAMVLSGCGVKDGSEIHESVTALLAIVKGGAEPLFYAPDINQNVVVNHHTGEASSETRSVLSEAARIARGEIKDLAELNPEKADAVVFPGGFGAALNLSSFATSGAECEVNAEVRRVIEAFNAASKPLGFICIAPAIAAKVLGPKGVQLTIGKDEATASALEQMGAKHIACNVDEFHFDENLKVLSTPAYMMGQNIAEIDTGISALINKLLSIC